MGAAMAPVPGRAGALERRQQFGLELADFRQQFIPRGPGTADAYSIAFKCEGDAKLGAGGQESDGAHVSTPSSSRSGVATPATDSRPFFPVSFREGKDMAS